MGDADLSGRIVDALLRDMREQGGTCDYWADRNGKMWVTLDGDFNITELADAVIRGLGDLHPVHGYTRPDGTAVTVMEANIAIDWPAPLRPTQP